jgi:hypothetical protein
LVFLFRTLRRALRRRTSSEFGHFDEVLDEARDKVRKPGCLRVSESLLFRFSLFEFVFHEAAREGGFFVVRN